MTESAEAETERVPKQQLQMFVKDEKVSENAIDCLLQKYSLWKTLRIAAYILQLQREGKAARYTDSK